MAVNDFVLRVSGTVAYSDNSNGSFESIVRLEGSGGGLIAQHNSAHSQYHFSQLYADMSTSVDEVLGVLGILTVAPPTTTPDKTVSSFVMEVSGFVVNDDGTKGPFVVQRVNGSVDVYPDDSSANWLTLIADTNGDSYVTQAFEALAGVGNVAT